MAETRQYAIWGSSGHAKVLAGLIAEQGGRIVALFDNDPSAKSVVDGLPVLVGEAGFSEWLECKRPGPAVSGLVAIGGWRGRERLSIQRRFREAGLSLHPLVHNRANVAASAVLGEGSQVLAHAVLAADVRIGEACIVNHKASVDHESILGDGVHVAPGATICGCVEIGENAFIGAGAVLLPRLKIGRNAIVAAGAIVIRDVGEGQRVAGNPAYPMKDRPRGA
jgi:sugar O-acyltransferase (sialic acid O-acetyltransferase NeuD family)